MIGVDDGAATLPAAQNPGPPSDEPADEYVAGGNLIERKILVRFMCLVDVAWSADDRRDEPPSSPAPIRPGLGPQRLHAGFGVLPGQVSDLKIEGRRGRHDVYGGGAADNLLRGRGRAAGRMAEADALLVAPSRPLTNRYPRTCSRSHSTCRLQRGSFSQSTIVRTPHVQIDRGRT